MRGSIGAVLRGLSLPRTSTTVAVPGLPSRWSAFAVGGVADDHGHDGVARVPVGVRDR